MKFDLSHAITELYPSAKYALKGFDYSGLEWYDERPKPSKEELQAKVNELETAEPMRLLKEERNQRIAESDWRFLSDQTPSSEWIDYRQALRDLPANSSPKLDENGQLINITWPEKPE